MPCGAPDRGLGIPRYRRRHLRLSLRQARYDLLDYRECGPQSEPRVVHIDQKCDYEIINLADNFKAFIRKLVHEDAFEEDGIRLATFVHLTA